MPTALTRGICLLVVFASIFISCKKDDPEEETPPPATEEPTTPTHTGTVDTTQATGQAMFWTGDLDIIEQYPVTITLSNGSFARTKNLYRTHGSSSGPECVDSQYNWYEEVNTGEYNYEAVQELNGLEWTGTLTVTEDACTKIRLEEPANLNRGKLMWYAASTSDGWKYVHCDQLGWTFNNPRSLTIAYGWGDAPGFASNETACRYVEPGTYTYFVKTHGQTSYSGPFSATVAAGELVSIAVD